MRQDEELDKEIVTLFMKLTDAQKMMILENIKNKYASSLNLTDIAVSKEK